MKYHTGAFMAPFLLTLLVIWISDKKDLEEEMKRIIFVRHGQKATLETSDDKLRKDLQLTSNGRAQAHLLGDYLFRNDIMIDYLFSSTMIRSIETAKIIGRVIKKDTIPIDGIEERFFYPISVPLEQVQVDLKKAQKDWSWAPKGGESLNQCMKRFEDGVSSVLNYVDDNTTSIVVTHSRVLQAYLHSNFGTEKITKYNSIKIFLRPTSMTWISYEDDEMDLECVGAYEHLK